MKRIFLAFIIIAASATVKAQDTTFVPDYGIHVLNDSTTLNDGTLIVKKVMVQPPMFFKTYVSFYFNIEPFNVTNSIYLKPKRNVVRLKQEELNHITNGKKVHEWLDMIYESRNTGPSDSLIITQLATKVYNNLVKGVD